MQLSAKMSIVFVLTCLIPLCLCTSGLSSGLSTEDLKEKLELAAAQVLSLHSFHTNYEDYRQEMGEEGDNERSPERFKRSLVSDIPHLNRTNRLIPEPELIRAQKISDVMTNLKERYGFQKNYYQTVMNSIKSAVKPNTKSVVMTSSLIRNLTVILGINAKQIKSLTNIVWQNSRLTIEDLKFHFKDLANLIIGVDRRIAGLFQATNDVVLRNRPTIITGRKRFVGHIEIPLLNVTSVDMVFVGPQNLGQIMSNLYRKSRPNLIKGVKHAVKPNLVKGSLNSRQINGIDFRNQIVTTNTPQTITGLVVYRSQLTVGKDLNINGRINDLKVETDLVFLNRPQTVMSHKIFTSPLVIANRVNSLTIDGIDLPKLTQSVLLSNGFRQIIESKLVFLKPLNTKSITVNGMVNKIDISLMANQLVYKNRPVLIRGRKLFILDDILIDNNLFVGKHLDGFAIPSDLLLRTRNQVITAPKHFRGNVRFDGKVTANGLVDGLRLPQDVVTLTGDDTIVGGVTFVRGIAVNQDIDARRLVDGVDISELRQYTLKRNDKRIESNVHFRNGVTVGAIELNGDVNGVNFGHLFREAIFRNSRNVTISGTKMFDSHVQMKQLFVDLVNGVHLYDLLSTNKNETILTPKVFLSQTSFKSLFVNGLVGGVNIGNLYNNRISLTKPETITGPKNFIDKVIITDHLSLNKINGLTPQTDFVLKSKPNQRINGKKIFTKTVTANKVVAKNPTIIKGKIDNQKINDLSSRVIPLNANYTLPLTVVLVNCNSTYIQVFGDMNGLNVTHFANNVMSLTKTQTVFGPKFFRGEQTFSSIQTSKGISGILLSYLNENAVHLNKLSHIRVPIIFTHPVVFKKPLALNGVLNGVNITYLANDAVYKNINNLIYGQNIFKSGFNVNSNIHAITFNGIDLSNELLTTTRDHIIKGNVNFLKTLVVNGDIELDGRVNGIDLSDFFDRVMKTNTKNIISGNLELIGSTTVKTNINIMGRLNGINLTQLYNDVLFANSDLMITGVKTIAAPVTILGHLNTNVINNVNMPKILEDIVYINSKREERVLAPKIFRNDISVNGLIQNNGIAIMGPINGVNLRLLDSESVKIDRPINLQTVINFKDLVIIVNNLTQIMGKINGIDLRKDVILLHTDNGSPQVISGKKIFNRLVLNDNAVINGLVNGYPLKTIEMNTFFTTNNQSIRGHKIAIGLVELSSPYNYIAFLNGKRILEDFVTLNGDQNVWSVLTFNEPLTVGRKLVASGSTSGQNIHKLATESLLRDIPQVLSHPIKFETIVFRGDVLVAHHVDNVDLSALALKVYGFTSRVNISQKLLVFKTNRHEYITHYMLDSLEKSLFKIDFFILYQNLDEIHGNRINVFNDNTYTISDTIGNRPTVYSIRYNPKSEDFESTALKQYNDLIHKTFVLNGEEFVVHMSPYSYNFSAYISKSGQMVAPIGPSINYIEVFSLSPTIVFVISYQTTTGRLLVHSLETDSHNKYKFSQVTESNVGTGTSKVVAFMRQNQVYVVVAKQYGLNCMTDSTGTLILILRNYRTLELIQTIPVLNVGDVAHFENYGKDYLAISDGTSAVMSSKGRQSIYIYRTDSIRNNCGFSLFQTIPFDNAIQLSAFTYGTIYSTHQYLIAFNTENIVIWKQRGESGFTESWTLTAKSARAVTPVLAESKLFIIVGQSYKCHESMIFKAETRGNGLAPIVFKTKYI